MENCSLIAFVDTPFTHGMRMLPAAILGSEVMVQSHYPYGKENRIQQPDGDLVAYERSPHSTSGSTLSLELTIPACSQTPNRILFKANDGSATQSVEVSLFVSRRTMTAILHPSHSQRGDPDPTQTGFSALDIWTRTAARELRIPHVARGE